MEQTLSSLAALSMETVSILHVTYLDYMQVSADEPFSSFSLFFEFEMVFHH